MILLKSACARIRTQDLERSRLKLHFWLRMILATLASGQELIGWFIGFMLKDHGREL